jgi:hypothetical protein
MYRNGWGYTDVFRHDGQSQTVFSLTAFVKAMELPALTFLGIDSPLDSTSSSVISPSAPLTRQIHPNPPSAGTTSSTTTTSSLSKLGIATDDKALNSCATREKYAASPFARNLCRREGEKSTDEDSGLGGWSSTGGRRVVGVTNPGCIVGGSSSSSEEEKSWIEERRTRLRGRSDRLSSMSSFRTLDDWVNEDGVLTRGRRMKFLGDSCVDSVLG